MKKGLLLVSLEELAPEVEEGEVAPVEPGELEAAMLAVMEAEQEVADVEDEMADSDDVVDNIETSVERLEAIRDAIVKYGICAPMMEAADPDRELVSAGIVGAYEELGDVPVKDANAEAAVEAIGTAVATVGAKAVQAAGVGAGSIVGLSPLGMAAVAAIALTAGLLAKFGPAVVNSLKSHKSALVSAEKSLNAAGSFDDEKFKGLSASVYSKEEFGRAIKAADSIIKIANAGVMSKIAMDIDGLMSGGEFSVEKVDEIAKKAGGYLKGIEANDDVKEIFGLVIDLADDGSFSKVTTQAPSVKPSKGTLGDHGWSAEDSKEAVKMALQITTEAEGVAKQIKDSVGATNKIIATLKKKLKKGAESSEDKGAYKQAVNTIRKAVDANKVIVKTTVNAVYKVNGVATQIAKFALKSVSK